MKKICFGIGDYSEKGGVERVTIQLANSFVEKQKEVFILTINSKYEKTTYEVNGNIKVINLKNEKKKNFKKKWMQNIMNISMFIKNIFKIRKFLKKNEISYLTGTDIKLTFLFYLSTIGLSTKIIATEHFEYDVPSKILKFLRVLFYNRLYKIVILTNEDLLKYEKIINNREKIQIIPNIIPYYEGAKKRDSSKVNKRIISVGRLTYQKGYDILIKVWSKIETKHKDWNLDIYGEGEDKQKLEELIKNLSIKNVRLKGFSDKIKEEYLKSDFYVMSSRFEGLPTVLIEALSCSLPVVSFACPSGPKSIILDGINGKLVEDGNLKDLEEKIELMIENKELRDKCSQNAVRTIDNFSENSVLKKWEKIFV